MDFKIEGSKSLEPFLKYEIFFPDADYEKTHYGDPKFVGNPIIGAMPKSYYLHFVLTEIIFQ